MGINNLGNAFRDPIWQVPEMMDLYIEWQRLVMRSQQANTAYKRYGGSDPRIIGRLATQRAAAESAANIARRAICKQLSAFGIRANTAYSYNERLQFVH